MTSRGGPEISPIGKSHIRLGTRLPEIRPGPYLAAMARVRVAFLHSAWRSNHSLRQDRRENSLIGRGSGQIQPILVVYEHNKR